MATVTYLWTPMACSLERSAEVRTPTVETFTDGQWVKCSCLNCDDVMQLLQWAQTCTVNVRLTLIAGSAVPYDDDCRREGVNPVESQ